MRKLTQKEIELLKKKQAEDKHPHIEILSLSPDKINILTQVRKYFDSDSLDILATDIAVNGIINMPNIIFYEREDAELYLKTINTIHQANHCLKDMVKGTFQGREGYFFLVAGERRSRAFQILKRKGCLRCRTEKANEIKEKGALEACYRSHFYEKEFIFPYKLMADISPFKALNIQMSENLYEKPNSHSEASMYASYYKLLKLINPSYTIAKFSRRVARNPRILSEFIGYIDLPIIIQKYVEEKVVLFGIARELVFLRNNLKKIGKSEEKMERLVEFAFTHAVSARMKVSKFKKYVRKLIEDEKSGQMELFELTPPKLRHVVDPLTKKAVQRENQYIKNILRLLEDGLLKEEDEVFKKNPELLSLIDNFMKTNKQVIEVANTTKKRKGGGDNMLSVV